MVLDQLPPPGFCPCNSMVEHVHLCRASEITRKHVEESRVRESQELSIFLGTHNSFRSTLKKQLTNNIQTHEDLICDIVNTCLHMYENNQYLLPADKHMLLKVRCLFPPSFLLFFLPSLAGPLPMVWRVITTRFFRRFQTLLFSPAVHCLLLTGF